MLHFYLFHDAKNVTVLFRAIEVFENVYFVVTCLETFHFRTLKI